MPGAVGGLEAIMGRKQVLMSDWNFSVENQMVLHFDLSIAGGGFEETFLERFHARSLAAFHSSQHLLQDFCWRGC